MKRNFVAILIVTLCFVTVQVFAQTAFNTGSIYGKATDANGPLPGVSVTLEAEGTAPKTSTTGPGGSYRFAGVTPGTYSVTFSLQGYTEIRQEDVKLTAGQSVNLEVSMKQTTEEVVVVSGAAAVVDTKRTSTSSTYSQEYLQNVPTARDPWVILDQTPGLEMDRINVGGNQSGQQSNFTSKGGLMAQNAWSYDGVDITDPAAQGATPTYYDFDSFQEIQITTGGQDPAIATGGVVINFITKRGGNSWAGTASGYFDNDSLQSNNVDADLISQHFIQGNRADANWEFGGDLGGPILKDKAWGWGAYRYQHISNFTPTVLVHDNPSPVLNNTLAGGARQFIKLSDVNGKANIAYNAENEGSFQYLYGNKDFDHRFSFPPNQQSEESTFIQNGPTSMFKAEHTWIPSANWFVDAKYGYIINKFNLDPVSGIAADAQPVLRLNADFFLENGNAFYHTRRPQHNVTVDTNYFVQNKWGGDHEFKLGFAYKNASVTTSCQYGGDAIFYDYSGARGDASLGAGVAKLRYANVPKFKLLTTGVYASDTFRLDRLTLNLGLRYQRDSSSVDASSAPANSVAPDLLPALSFPGSNDLPVFNSFSPRIGATWDVKGDGKTVIRGNYARFYDGNGPQIPTFINPLGVPFVNNYAGVYTYYADLNGDGQITRDEIDTSFLSPFRAVVPGDAQATVDGFATHRFIADDFKLQTTVEFLAGFERQFGEDVSVGATFTHRKYDNLQNVFIPGVTSADFTCNPLTVTNPVTGESFTTNFCDIPGAIAARDQYVLLNAPGQTRTYDGLEFTFNKRMSHGWMLRMSGVVQDQKLHFADNSTTFPGSFQDPTNVPFTDDTWFAQQSTGSGSVGVFTGSRWSFKLSSAYQFPWDLTVGGYFKMIDGNVVPVINRRFQSYSQGILNVLLLPFDSVRLETIKYMDLRIDKGFAAGSFGKLNVSLDIFNAFNTNTALRIERRANTFQFREPQEIVAPRILRLGLRYTF